MGRREQMHVLYPENIIWMARSELNVPWLVLYTIRKFERFFTWANTKNRWRPRVALRIPKPVETSFLDAPSHLYDFTGDLINLIIRLYMVSPRDVEWSFLRILLLHISAAKTLKIFSPNKERNLKSFERHFTDWDFFLTTTSVIESWVIHSDLYSFLFQIIFNYTIVLPHIKHGEDSTALNYVVQ